jgi:hypothetical protein
VAPRYRWRTRIFFNSLMSPNPWVVEFREANGMWHYDGFTSFEIACAWLQFNFCSGIAMVHHLEWQEVAR